MAARMEELGCRMNPDAPIEATISRPQQHTSGSGQTKTQKVNRRLIKPGQFAGPVAERVAGNDRHRGTVPDHIFMTSRR
jgi:hypothetical protein